MIIKKRPIASVPVTTATATVDIRSHKVPIEAKQYASVAECVSFQEGRRRLEVSTKPHAVDLTLLQRFRSMLTASFAGVLCIYLMSLLLQPSKYFTAFGSGAGLSLLVPVDFALFAVYAVYRMAAHPPSPCKSFQLKLKQKLVFIALILGGNLLLTLLHVYVYHSSHLRTVAFGGIYFYILSTGSIETSLMQKLLSVLALSVFDMKISRQALYNTNNSYGTLDITDSIALHIISFLLVDFFYCLLHGGSLNFRYKSSKRDEEATISDESMRRLYEATVVNSAPHSRRKLRTPPLTQSQADHNRSQKTNNWLHTISNCISNIFYGRQLILADTFEHDRGIVVCGDVLSFPDNQRINSRFDLTISQVSNDKVLLSWKIPRSLLVDLARVKGVGPFVSFDTTSNLLIAEIEGAVEISTADVKVLVNGTEIDNDDFNFNFSQDQVSVEGLVPDTQYSISLDFCGYRCDPVHIITSSEPTDFNTANVTEIRLKQAEIVKLTNEIGTVEREIQRRDTLNATALQSREAEIRKIRDEIAATESSNSKYAAELEKMETGIAAARTCIEQDLARDQQHDIILASAQKHLSEAKAEASEYEKQILLLQEEAKSLEVQRKKLDETMRREKKRRNALDKQMKEQTKLFEKAQNDWQVQSSILNDDLKRLDKEKVDIISRIDREQSSL